MALLALFGFRAVAQPAYSSRFGAEISAFEEADRRSPPRANGILFLGSSSIRLWKLDQSFPGRRVINRGFGGSRIEDSVAVAERIVAPHHPRQVVFYAGDNDVAEGMTPEKVYADFRALVETLRNALPNIPVVFIAIKPSLSRWNQFELQSKANRLIRDYCRRVAGLTYLDVVRPMLRDGRPRPELFQNDGLHLTPAGYQLWTSLLKPHLVTGAETDPHDFE